MIAAAEEPANPSPWGSLIFFGLIFLAMYFLLLRPQRKRMREAQNLQRELAVGDEVVLTSGVYGFVTALETMDGTDIAWIEIGSVNDTPLEVRTLRTAIARRIPPQATAENESK